jgi:glyoxylate reductase
MRPAIYVTQPIPDGALARLRAAGEVELNPDPLHIPTKDELLGAVRRTEYLVCLLHDRIDGEVIQAAPRLKLIASMAIVPAGVDVAAATARRIPVTSIPPLVTEATADLHWGLLLAVARRVVEGDQALRAGFFPGGQSEHLVGADVHGQTLGIVGLGRIGEAVARRARGFGMRILYTKRRRLGAETERALGVTYASLDDLLRASDFVSIHALLGPETVHLIGARELALMRPTAFLVNTARGPVVDEKALVDALRAGKIAGAALDVFEQEPLVEPGLLTLPNTVLTPHLGSGARGTRDRIAAIVADNVLAAIEGRRPPNVYNPEVYGSEQGELAPSSPGKA